MEKIKNYMGLDIGSMYLKIAVLNNDGELINKIYEPHFGRPIEVLKERIKEYNNAAIGLTGIGASMLKSSSIRDVNLVKSTVTGIKNYFDNVRNIIDIGSGSATLIELDEKGELRNYQTNSLCAAGTGSFLDEQAQRLGISYKESAAFEHIENPPTIASRCTVFAKSDLIHRQQEGATKEQMWSGLCRGLTITMLQTLFKGKPVRGRTILVGGVSLNNEVIRWLETLCNAEIVRFDNGHIISAIGVSLLCKQNNDNITDINELLNAATFISVEDKDKIIRRQALKLEKTKYPSFDVSEQYIDENNTEVRINNWQEKEGKVRGYIGIDIGSTSTKAVIINDKNEVVLDLYRKTLGDPIGATRYLFHALKEIEKNKKTKFEILGAGTTGSGRKLVGQIIGADSIINEISAHVQGAIKTVPGIETIFEIGGQDSKYMRVKDGAIYESNMNYVCAAGTGSFVEEQAKKLGFSLNEVGDVVLGISPPPTSDRCTVFMEQDVHKLIKMGFSRQEVMAGVMNSIVLNYLNKVVGKRYISKGKVAFMGATARNKGLVAAFEKTLDVEVVVSPYCHVMGAYGLAMLTRDEITKTKQTTSFRGLDVMDKKIDITHEKCDLCSNYCMVTFASIEGFSEKPSWGYMCGRDAEDHKKKPLESFSLIEQRNKLWRSIGYVKVSKDAPTIGIPRTLGTYSYLPLYMKFLGNLGFNVVLSKESDEEIKASGSSIVGADFCFPVKLAHGHIQNLIKKEGVDYIFIPHVIAKSLKKYKGATDTNFCPYLQGFPSVAEAALDLNRMNSGNILRPIVDLKSPIDIQLKKLIKALAAPLGRSSKEIKDAWFSALDTLGEFEIKVSEIGQNAIEELNESGKFGIVLVGRPYNIYDNGCNVSLPRKIAQYGYKIIPVDMIPFKPESVTQDYKNIFWNYTHTILSAIKYVHNHPQLFPIYFTNYSCGPDSFNLTFAEQLIGNKPLLIIELDEHGADAGYITRVEAFLDVIKHHEKQKATDTPAIKYPKSDSEEFKNRKIWIPAMHPFGSPLFAAAFRRHGYDCQPLPDENREIYDIGRKVTRGMECLPTSLTIGGMLKVLREENNSKTKHALFMPTAEGPCRFGQYATLHRMILNKEGYEDVPIMSPSSCNAYQGVSEKLRQDLWRAMLVGDLISKFGCKVRPYEKVRGDTDRVIKEQLNKMIHVFETGGDIIEGIRSCARVFESIPKDTSKKKPLVGIIGEIYVRANTYSNEDVIHTIEEGGGEAWLTPLSEWILYTTYVVRHRLYRNMEGKILPMNLFKGLISDGFINYTEHKYYKEAGPLLNDRHEPPVDEVISIGRRYIPLEFEGEAILTVGRGIMFAKQGASLLVNCSPFGCMPGTISTAIYQKLQEEIGIPVANMFYDGEGGLNDRIRVFIANIVKEEKQKFPAAEITPPQYYPEKEIQEPQVKA